jgi:hypothetical protein
MSKQVRLSASTIKTFINCSYLFYQNYIKLVPQKQHESLPKGTLVHLVLELLLLKPKRKEMVQSILKFQSINSTPALARFVHKRLAKYNLDSSLVFKEIESWIITGLRNEYFGSTINGVKPKLLTEQQFSLPLNDYEITGTIDKIAIFDDELIIYDYKSSKQKFSGEDKEANIQAMLYLWAARQLFPGKKKYSFKFVFLRFPRNPIQEHTYSEIQIDGFTSWIEYILPLMANMDAHAAHANFAADDKNKSWLCKAGATWKCPYLEAFEYFQVTDEKGNFVRNSLTIPLNVPLNHRISKKTYEGCARFVRAKAKEDIEDFYSNE